jgi:hypothetical protein
MKRNQKIIVGPIGLPINFGSILIIVVKILERSSFFEIYSL